VERAEPELERTARRARRVLWGFRAVFYGGATVAAALLLTGGGDERPAFAEGQTSQGRAFTMRFENGRPTSLGTSFTATCDDGEPWSARWWSFDAKTARFDFEGGVLRVRERLAREYENDWTGDRDYTLEARVDDEGVSGTMRLVENLRHPGGTASVCKSGDVSFSGG
jgi:hypothetical protein